MSETEKQERVPATRRWIEGISVTLPWDRSLSTDGQFTCQVGRPRDDHNCDEMGCSSLQHVLKWRDATEEEKDYHSAYFQSKHFNKTEAP